MLALLTKWSNSFLIAGTVLVTMPQRHRNYATNLVCVIHKQARRERRASPGLRSFRASGTRSQACPSPSQFFENPVALARGSLARSGRRKHIAKQRSRSMKKSSLQASWGPTVGLLVSVVHFSCVSCSRVPSTLHALICVGTRLAVVSRSQHVVLWC